MENIQTAQLHTRIAAKPVIKGWPRKSRRVAEETIATYGMPHDSTPNMLVWYYNSPWKRTVVYREGTPHNFPKPHLDVIKQTIDYYVPKEACNNLAIFDGSILIDRTRRELSSRCNSEEMNIAMLNLAHDIIIGNKTPEQARAVCGKIAHGLWMRWPDPYTSSLHVSLKTTQGDRERTTPDPDRPAISVT